MPSSQEYAQQLLDEATRTLSPLVKGLEADFQNLRLDVSASLSRLAGKLDALHNLELPTSGIVLTQIFEEISRRQDDEWSGIADFSQKLRQGETQEEILNLLMDRASQYAPRLVLFVTRGEAMMGWSSRGFSEDTAGILRSTSFPRSESSAIGNALGTSNPSEVLETARETRLLDLLKGEAPGPWHLYPMRALRRPVAVLLAADVEGKRTNPAVCRVLVDMTALQLENIALQILQELGRTAPESPGAVSSTSAPAWTEKIPVAGPEESRIFSKAAEEAPEEPSLSMPESPVDSMSGEFPTSMPLQTAAETVMPPVVSEVESEPVEELMAETEVDEIAASTESPELDVAEVELESELETLHTEILTETPTESAEASVLTTKEDPRLAEEERLHSDAKRFARLLVSEIKLYNEQRVIEGRENKDVYVRLKRDIDRSREMYEKRVAPSVSRKIDYFHDEIIRILGDNDPLTLGSDYPGPRIES
jgi:hypothetical protein